MNFFFRGFLEDNRSTTNANEPMLAFARSICSRDKATTIPQALYTNREARKAVEIGCEEFSRFTVKRTQFPPIPDVDASRGTRE